MSRLYRVVISVCITILALTSSGFSKEDGKWEIGLFASGTLGYDLLGDFWESAPAAGVEILYPFHPRVPVTLSIQGSNHRAESSPPDRGGYHKSEYDLLAIHTTLMFTCLFREQKALQPYLGGGLTNTLFITYIDFPPPENSDESEYGMAFNAGVQYHLNERFVIFGDYRQNIVFTLPRQLHFGTPRAGIRMKLFKKESSNDS